MAYDLGTAHGKIELEYTGKSEAAEAERDMDRLRDSSKDADGELRRLSSTLGKVFGSTAKASALAFSLTQAGAAAGGMAIQIAGIVPQLASLASLSAALPGLYATGAIAIGVMKASLAGFGEAAKEAFSEDPAKFNEALEKLAPAAREAAVALRGIAPGLRQVQQGLQQAFFESSLLAEFMPRLLSRVQSLAPALNVVAGQFGELTRRFALFALSSDSVDFVRHAIAQLQISLRAVTPALAPLLTGLRDVGNVGLPLIGQLGTAVGDLGRRFGEWLSEISADGRLEDWIDTALETMRSLGTIAQNVGSILNSIFSTANATGGGLLNTLAEITGQFADFLDSAAGQEALSSLFTGILEVARQLAPVFTTLAGALAGALGPALADLATSVGPVLLQVVQALAPAFRPLAQAIADVLIAVAPLLPPLAQLISMLVGSFASGLSALAAELGPTIALLGQTFAEALTILAPLLLEVARNALPLAAAFGADLVAAIAPLMPHIIELATALAESLLPALPQLTAAAAELLPQMIQLAVVMGGLMSSAIQAIIPYIPVIVQGLVSMATTFYSILGVGLKVVTWLMQFGQALFGLPSKISAVVTGLVGGLVNGLKSAYNGVVTFGEKIITWFTELPGKIGSFLSQLPGVVGRFVVQAMNRMAFEFGAGIGRVITFTATFPGKVKNAISALLSTLGNAAKNAWNAARNAFSSGVNTATNLARTLPGKIRGAIAALPGQIANVARDAWNRLRNAFSSGVSSATSVARGLPGRIRSAVGNLGSLLVGAGRDAVMGLVRGLRNAIGAAVSAAASVGRSVINGIKSTLKIGSPSKVLMEVGVDTGDGFVIGLLKQLDQVKQAAMRLANTAIAPTLNLNAGTMARNATAPVLRQLWSPNTPRGEGAGSPTRTYNLNMDGKVIASFVVDTITGNPITVAKSADEGNRKKTFFGSGR